MKTLRLLSLLFVWAIPLTATAQMYQQDFENYSSLFTGTNPWTLINRSDSPTGGTNWFPGDSSIFSAQGGSGYVAANYFSTGGLTGTETASNWLLSPTLNFTNGSTVTFFTRSAGAAPDRLQVRLSVNGTSADVGTTSASVGDFTILLLDINPLVLSGGYPTGWTPFAATIIGVPLNGATGRLGFRYNVPNTGLNGVNGDYVGLDNLTVVPEPSTWALGLVGLSVLGFVIHRRQQSARA